MTGLSNDPYARAQAECYHCCSDAFPEDAEVCDAVSQQALSHGPVDHAECDVRERNKRDVDAANAWLSSYLACQTIADTMNVCTACVCICRTALPRIMHRCERCVSHSM